MDGDHALGLLDSEERDLSYQTRYQAGPVLGLHVRFQVALVQNSVRRALQPLRSIKELLLNVFHLSHYLLITKRREAVSQSNKVH